MSTRLSLGSLSLVLDLTMKKGVGLPCTNWSGAGVALLMSPRQGETSQYEAICVACQAESQFSGYMRPPHGPRRCVNMVSELGLAGGPGFEPSPCEFPHLLI